MTTIPTGPGGGETEAPVNDAAAAMRAGDYRRAAALAHPRAMAGDPGASKVMNAIAVDPVASWAGVLTTVVIVGYWALVR